MIAGLPWTAWLLLAAAVGIGLAIELRFYRAHRSGGNGGEPPSGAEIGAGSPDGTGARMPAGPPAERTDR